MEEKKFKKQYISATVFILLAAAVAFITGREFLALRAPDVIIPGPGVTEVVKLSQYFDGLAGTNGDTDVYILRGEKPGGSILVLGGTHGNEPSGYLTAVTLIENAKIDEGTMYIIPRANNSGFTHNDAQEGSPMYMHFTNPAGEERTFRYGSRATNPVDSWPDPDVYVHAASGQRLSGSETRNLNRAYPGRPDGSFTEKITYGIVNLIKEENIDVTIDLHEASPEYPVINATVAGAKAMEFASLGVINLEMSGIPMRLEPSPANLRGLTHRELAEFTDTLPILIETSNPSQGRFRGRTDEALVLTGIDKSYIKAAELHLLAVPYDANGHPLELRVARHTQSIVEYMSAYTELHSDNPMSFSQVHTYEEILNGNIGDFLN